MVGACFAAKADASGTGRLSYFDQVCDTYHCCVSGCAGGQQLDQQASLARVAMRVALYRSRCRCCVGLCSGVSVHPVCSMRCTVRAACVIRVCLRVATPQAQCMAACTVTCCTCAVATCDVAAPVWVKLAIMLWSVASKCTIMQGVAILGNCVCQSIHFYCWTLALFTGVALCGQ